MYKKIISRRSFMREVRKRKNSIKEAILRHLYDNIKLYLIVIIILIIGIIAGVVFINNINADGAEEIKNYITDFINQLKQGYRVDTGELLKKSLSDNLILIVIMWLLGSTVVGIPIVLGIVLFRGFCIGYSLSAIIASLGVQKGILFFLTTMFLQNLIFIPVILCMTISCIKLYKSIMKDRRRENIKVEIIRHTLVSIMLGLLLIIAAFIESYVSTNLLMLSINFF
jgi:stage II sporulation protein M